MQSKIEISPKLTVKQAAQVFPVSESYIRHKVMDRSIPHIKCGRKVLIDAEKFNAWLDAHAVEAK